MGSKLLAVTGHSHLVAGERGPLAKRSGRRPVEVMLRQGELDGACGVYCVWMALIALGLAAREWLVKENRGRAERAQGRVWKRCKGAFVDGLSARGIVEILQPYQNRVRTELFRGSGAPAMEFVLDALARDALCIVGVHTSDWELSHWVLATGVAGIPADNGGFQPCELVLLDPSYPGAPHKFWNATLSVAGGNRRRRRLTAELDGRSRLVWIEDAVSIGLRAPGAQP